MDDFVLLSQLKKPFMTCLFIIFLLIPSGTVFSASPVVEMVSTSDSPAVGDTFAIALFITKADSFANWAQFLRFDKRKLKFVSQFAGTFKSFIPDSRDTEEINRTGEIRAGGFGLSDNSGGAGTLGIFKFVKLTMDSTVIRTEPKSKRNPFGLVIRSREGKYAVPEAGKPLIIGTR